MARLCYKCMRITTDEDKCEHCGFDAANWSGSRFSGAFPLGAPLGRKYIVGSLWDCDILFSVYSGLNVENGARVFIREYFPQYSAVRSPLDALRVNVDEKNTGIYRKYLDRSYQHFKELSALRIPAAERILEIGKMNNTLYVVSPMHTGKNLREAVSQNDGLLLFNQAYGKYLRPVIQSLMELHKHDMLHTLLDASDIILDGDTVLLTGFEKRIMNAYIMETRDSPPILPPWSAATEVYLRKGNCGPWTDVYSVCAILLYCLTGRRIRRVPERLDEDRDNLWEAESLPEDLRRILSRGLAFFHRDRIQSMEELFRLLEDYFASCRSE